MTPTHSSFDQSPQRYVRAAGVMYLAIIVLGFFGEMVVRAALVVPGNAAATASNIVGSQLLWRAGIVGDLLMHVLDVPVIVIFYLLLKPVSKPLALTATLMNVVQTAVLVANKLNLLVPVFLLGGATYQKAFSAEQLQALSSLAINMHGHGFGIGLVFFGFASLMRGYLIAKCAYLPKTLGVLLFIAGLSYLINSVALLLEPAFAGLIFPAVLVPAFVGELALSLWLIVKGVNTAEWQRQVALRRAAAD